MQDAKQVDCLHFRGLQLFCLEWQLCQHTARQQESRISTRPLWFLEKNLRKCLKIHDPQQVSYKMIIFKEKSTDLRSFLFGVNIMSYLAKVNPQKSRFIPSAFPMCQCEIAEEQREQRFTNSVHQIVRQGGKCGDPNK